MRNDLNNIDDLFRAGLGGYSEVPPPDVWVALEQRLDNDKKKRPFGWRWFIMAMLCAGAGGSMFAWRTATRGDGAPSASQASIASVQQAKAPQGKSAGNTSAATESTTASNTGNSVNHKHHKHNNNNTAAVATPSVAGAATANTTAANNSNTSTNINSPASNSTPVLASAAEPTGNRQEERAADKAAAIKYIISNKKYNNIAVAESDEDAPSIAANNYTDARDEDNVTFGKRPSVDMDAPIHTQATTPKVVTPAYASSAPRNRKARNANRRGNPNAVNFSMGAPVVRNTPAAANTIARNDQPTATSAPANKTTAVAKTAQNTGNTTATPNTNGAVTITTPVAGNITPAGKGTLRARTTKPASATTPSGSGVAAKTSPAQVVPASSAAKPATTPATVTKANTTTSTTAGKPATAAKTTTTKPTVAATTKPATKPTTTKEAATTAAPAVALQKKATGRRPVKRQNNSVTPSAVVSVKPTAAPTTVTAKPTATTGAAKSSALSAPVAINATTPAKRRPARVKTSASATAAKPVNTPIPAIVGTPAAKSSKPAKAVNRLKSTGAATPKPKTANTLAAKQPAKTKGKPVTTPASASANALAANTSAQPKPIVPAAKPNVEAPAPKATTPPLQAAPKPADTTPIASAPATDSSKKHLFKGITYGIKGGYEGGFSGSASRKVVIAPYFEKQLSGKFSVMAQPALKISKVQANNLNGTQNYYSIDPNSKVTVLDSALIPMIQNNQQMGYLVRVNLAYHEQHDSIVKSYATGGSYVEMELPIMLKYAINPKLSVYGGINLNYSRYVAIKEKTFIAQSITVDDTTFTILPAANPPIRSVLQYSGANINSYSGPLYNNQSGGIFRMGMMLGVSYEFRKRWMIDAMMTKNAAKANVQGGYDVNKPLSATYFRFTLGYRLSK